MLDAGADPNFELWQGNTFLFMACAIQPNPEIVRDLIKAGADVNVMSDDGFSILNILFIADHDNPEVLRTLLANGVDPNHFPPFDDSGLLHPLAYATGNKLFNSVPVLLEFGSDPNTAMHNGNTPLHLCMTSKPSIPTIKHLLNAGADPNSITKSGNSPLSVAARKTRNPQTITQLLDAGADITHSDNLGDTPLILASRSQSDSRIVRLLLEHGAKVNTTNNKGETALTVCSNAYSAAALINAGAEIHHQSFNGTTVLISAAYKAKNTDHVQLLIDLGADVNASNMHGRTALLNSVTHNMNIDTVELLLEAGADPNVWATGHTDPTDLTPLMIALTRHNNPELIELLIKHGADPDLRVKYQTTLDHTISSSTYNGYDTLKILINYCDIEQPDERGITALIRACDSGRDSEVVLILLEAGADPNKKDHRGKSALDYARRNKYLSSTDVITRLEQATSTD